MSFRFFKRIKIAPGITLNLSKSGGSVSLGPRGAKITVGGSRGTRTTVGIPGTGIHYTELHGTKKQRKAANRAAQGGRYTAALNEPAVPLVRPDDRLTMGFFRKLFTPADEQALVAGLRAIVQSRFLEASQHLQKARHIADGAFLAGIAAFKVADYDTAVMDLKIAAVDSPNLGRYFAKYGIESTISIPITDHIWAHIHPDLRGTLLALVEALQEQGKHAEAIPYLKRLLRMEPHDTVLKLSMAELLDEANPDDVEISRQIVKLADGVENHAAVDTALLMYKAKALHKLGLATAAREVLTALLRRTSNRPAELMTALRYERALVYETLGQRARSRSEFEKIYAKTPFYEDVAQRLGL